MPRIAIVSPYTMPFNCGNSVLAERLREGLAGRGYAVDVFNSNDPAHIPLAYSPDILHTLNAEKSSAWAEMFLSRRAIPRVISFTGTDYGTWRESGEPPPHILKAMERASALIFFHEEAAAALKDAAPEIRAKTRIIQQGVAPVRGSADRRAVRGRLGIPPDAVVFLLVAGIRPVKNLGLALEAFAEVEKRLANVRLLLIGPVIDREEAGKVLAMGDGLRCFTYLGERPHAEVREIMAGVDVLLNTSLHEGMPCAIQEAMSEGKPVIVSAVSGNTALVRHGENGLLFPSGNVGELAGAVVRLAGDGVLRTRLGEAGRQFVEAEYSLGRELDGYCSVYTSIIESSGIETIF